MDFTEEEKKVLSELDDMFRKERVKKRKWMSINPFVLWIITFIVMTFLYSSELITYEISVFFIYLLPCFIIFSLLLNYINCAKKLKVSLRLIKKLVKEVNLLRHDTRDQTK